MNIFHYDIYSFFYQVTILQHLYSSNIPINWAIKTVKEQKKPSKNARLSIRGKPLSKFRRETKLENPIIDLITGAILVSFQKYQALHE